MPRRGILGPGYWHPQAARPRNFLRNGPAMWRPQSPPISGYRRQVQTYIGGYGVGSATTRGQVASNTAASLTTLTVTLKTPTLGGTGDCLVACVNAIAATTAPTVSGITLGGSADNWVSAETATSGGIGPNLAVWIDPNCKAGQTSVVITLTGGAGANPNIEAVIFEIPGLLSSPLDAAPAGLTGAGASPSTPFASGLTGILAQPYEVAIGCVGWADGQFAATLPGSPWTEYQQLAGNPVIGAMAAGYQVVTTPNSLIYSGNIAGNTFVAACIITLKVSPLVSTIGGAQLSLGPAGYGTRWYPNQVNVATAVGAADSATCTGYLNFIGQGGFLFQSYAGGGDQIGLAVPEMVPGELMYVVWTGSQPATAVQAILLGSQSVLSN